MPYGLGLQFTFAVCLWVLLDLARARGPLLHRLAFALLATSCAAWALGEMWVQAAQAPESIVAARRLLWLGAALLPPAWLAVAAEAAGAPWMARTPWRAAGFAVPMLLIYSMLWWNPQGSFTSWTVKPPVHGPFLYVFVALGWAQIALGTAYFMQAAIRHHKAQPLRVVAIAVGATLPVFGNLIHFLPHPPSVDLTPVFLGFGGLLIRLSVLDAGLASILPMSHSDVFEQVPTGVLLADLQGRVVDSNRAARRLLGAERVEGLALERLLTQARDLPERTIEIEIAPLHRALGDAGRVALLTDRTEEAQLQRQLLQAQKLESLGLLAGGVAHDFNNLLTGILGNAHLALASLVGPHPARDCLEDVIQASELAARLTGQMLAYSGRGRLDVRAVDLSREVQGISALLQSSVSKNVQLVLDLAEELPPIEADPAQVQQVLLNLVINAAEAIGDRAGVVRVTTGASALRPDELLDLVSGAGMKAGVHPWLEVRDTGCGMDSATLGRMFDPFYSTKFAGRGLGLAAVLGIARGHRAGLRVRSEEGTGTTIRIYFPAGGSLVADAAAARVAAQQPMGQGLVLVVDDESIVRETARRALERAGFQVLLADSGRKAVEIFRTSRAEICLVLLDVTMPDASGLETFAELRRIEPELPILLSSGYTEEAAASACEGDPLAGFVPKPYAPDELTRRIREMLLRA
jgi:signal transduction histidine kinase